MWSPRRDTATISGVRETPTSFGVRRFDLPPFVLLTKDGHKVGDEDTQPWPDGFSELDGGLIEDLGENGTLYKINYDNAYHTLLSG